MFGWNSKKETVAQNFEEKFIKEPEVIFKKGIYTILAVVSKDIRTYVVLNNDGLIDRLQLFMGTPIDKDITNLVGARADIEEVREDTEYYKNSINKIIK